MTPMQREDRNGIVILHIDGELDFENTVWLRSELHELFKNGQYKIILDLAKVELISSYTVGVFVAFARDLREREGDLKFVHLQRRVMQTFQATRINHILQVFENTDEAVEAFSEPVEGF